MTATILPKDSDKNTQDDFYSDRVDNIEESLNFFIGKEIKVEETEDVSGTESFKGQGEILSTVIKEFGKNKSSLQLNNPVDGTESFKEKAASALRSLIQFAKDVVAWIVNLINNKITRIDNRRFRISSRRKRYGLKTKDEKYPSSVKRLIIPSKVTEDGQWVKESIIAVNDFYTTAVTVYKGLLDHIKIEPNHFDLNTQIEDVNRLFVNKFNLQIGPKGSDGVISYHSGVLPGNRYFVYQASTAERIINTPCYFDNTTIESKLKSPTFGPTSFIIDSTLTSIADLINKVRSNQKNVGELHRIFEKEVVSYINKHGEALGTRHKTYLNWLITLSKTLNGRSINYVTSSIDGALDFCEAGINE
ncbi:putative internal head protein [Aeromonas phage ZPAH34]|uniref:putative internal head protein n=1 Tax=Aeromonas phage ZPAH34 TaxID=2924888 RepID=UPI0023298EDE|nr:putative internal head protein [Aeromonas phage ZPAH34]UOX39602.1 putative internal head protein [Aeromonas phage ZPAH34]